MRNFPAIRPMPWLFASWGQELAVAAASTLPPFLVPATMCYSAHSFILSSTGSSARPSAVRESEPVQANLVDIVDAFIRAYHGADGVGEILPGGQLLNARLGLPDSHLAGLLAGLLA